MNWCLMLNFETLYGYLLYVSLLIHFRRRIISRLGDFVFLSVSSLILINGNQGCCRQSRLRWNQRQRDGLWCGVSLRKARWRHPWTRPWPALRWPIRAQYPGHVICLNQWQASITWLNQIEPEPRLRLRLSIDKPRCIAVNGVRCLADAEAVNGGIMSQHCHIWRARNT